MDHDKDLEQTLAVILNSMAQIKCSFCLGCGHISSECASKRNVDNAVKRVPPLRILWGTLKGSRVSTGKRTNAMVKGADKVLLEVEVAKRAKEGMKGANVGKMQM